MVKMVAHRVLDQPRCLGRSQPVLGLALKLRLADKDRQHQFGFVENILGGNLRRLLIANDFAKCAQALGQRGAYARFVRAAIGGWDGVAIPAV